MLDAYFCPRVARRLRASPDAATIDSFIIYLHRRSHTYLTIQNYVRAAEVYLHYLRHCHKSLVSIDETDVRAFASRRRSIRRPRHTVHAALRHLVRHLRDEGVIAPRPAVADPAREQIIADYDTHLRDAGGLAPATRQYRRRYVREFLSSVFGTKPVRWHRIKAAHVRSFIGQYGHNGRAAAAQVAAGSLRSFLRWLRMQGHVDGQLIAAAPRFPRWRWAGLPTVMSDVQLQAFLETFDRSTPKGRRDYAMALCMTDLGLRVVEVATLTLDDLDEPVGVLHLRGGKSRRDRTLPMPRRLRQAVACYRRDRPETGDRHLFLRHRAPLAVGVSRELIRGVMRRAYAKVAGCEEWTGTHVLRHTAATRLHRAGADLKRVADILGHRSIDTTVIYTKVDTQRLIAVALPWPAAKEVQP